MIVVTSLLALHHKNVLVGWPPITVHPQGGPQQQLLAGKPAGTVNQSTNLWPVQQGHLGVDTSYITAGLLQSKGPRKTGRKLLWVAFSALAFETLEVTKYRVNVFHWSKQSQVQICKEIQTSPLNKSVKKFWCHVFDGHHGFLNLYIVCNSLQMV